MTLNEYSAGAMIINEGRVLLVFQKKTQTWAFPKGHIEDGESEFQAVLREVEEETGICKLNFIKNLGKYARHSRKSANVIKHISMFLFTTKEFVINPKTADVTKVDWVTPARVCDLLSYDEDKHFYSSVRHEVEYLIQDNLL